MDREQKAALARRQKFFVFGDLFVFAVLLVLLAAVTAIAFLLPREEGNSFTVYFRGEAIFSAPLDEDAVYVFTVESGAVTRYDELADYRDYNILAVSEGKVCVREADCRSQDCVRHGAADWGEIVCLPHALRIEVEGEEAQPPTDFS